MASEPTAQAAETPVDTPTPETPQTQPATREAVQKGSFADFRAASRAKLAGQSLPDAPIQPAASGEPASAKPAPKKIALSPDELNDRIRTAVERAIQDHDRLRAQPVPPARPMTPPPPVVPDWQRYAAKPDAPKLEQFESVEAHTAAMSAFVARQMLEERDTAQRQSAEQAALTEAQMTRAHGLIERVNQAKASDPDFISKLSPEVLALKPFDALLPGEASGPANVIAEQIFDSPLAPQVLRHLSEHPEDLQRLTSIPDFLQTVPPALRTRQHIGWIVREFGKLEAQLAATGTPSVSRAPSAPSPVPVPTTLGTKPAAPTDPLRAAHASNDFGAFRRASQAARLATGTR